MWDSLINSGWSSRSLGGPLLSSDMFKTADTNFNELSKWNLQDCVFGFKEAMISEKVLKEAPVPSPLSQVKDIRTKLNTEVVTNTTERSRRRRPTYSSKVLRALSKESEESVNTNSSSDKDETNASAKDLRQSKILEFRKLLTQTVKIKTAIFYEKVKVTCSKDGKNIEWYKSKSEEDGSKKPLGNLPVSKITNVATKSDNIKYLEIFAGNNSFLFMFRTREEREQWQTDFTKFLKFMELVK